MRPVAWFVLDHVKSSSGEKPQYLVAGTHGGEGQPCDFTLIRVYTWGVASARVRNRLCRKRSLRIISDSRRQTEPEPEMPEFRFNGLTEKEPSKERVYVMRQTSVRRVREERIRLGAKIHATKSPLSFMRSNVPALLLLCVAPGEQVAQIPPAASRIKRSLRLHQSNSLVLGARRAAAPAFWTSRAAIAIDAFAAVYLADAGTPDRFINKFTRGGHPLQSFEPMAQIRNPCAAAVDRGGAIYVLECSAGVLYLFALKGKSAARHPWRHFRFREALQHCHG